MISFLPSYILAKSVGRVYDPTQPRNLLPLYEYFARKAISIDRWHLESLSDTSSINNSELRGFSDMDSVGHTLGVLFASVGQSNSRRADLLASRGIRTWKDLARPICLPGWDRPDWFPHNVREQRLKKSWNGSHPDAVFGQCAYLQFGAECRWRCVVAYGYSHDSSTWYLELRQKQESLAAFCVRAKAWLDDLFVSDDAISRQCCNRDYDTTTSAVDNVFWGGYSGNEEKFVAALLAVDGGGCSQHRIELNSRRLAVLRRWMKQDKRRAWCNQGKS